MSGTSISAKISMSLIKLSSNKEFTNYKNKNIFELIEIHFIFPKNVIGTETDYL